MAATSAPKIGDYLVVRELGQGGMGKVFQALSPTGTTVAIKTMLLPQGMDARARWETVERFQREARAARSLKHPAIVQVLDIGADQDAFFIVMEYLDGQTIREIITAIGPISVGRAVEIATCACQALAYAHGQGIIHRDVKPDNIMVLRDGSTKLTDFGLAAIVAEKGVTQTGTVMGTFSYMSPEQVRGEKLDARSDIFSLGATFYEMLSGRQPFPGDTPAVVLNSILKQDPAPIADLPPHVSRTLSQCLRKDPQQRFHSAQEVAASLQGRTAHQPASTAILPGRAGAPAAAANAPPAIVASLTAPPPVFRCSKCGEPMSKTAPSCWKCGEPNSLMTMHREQAKRQQQVDAMLRDFRPRSGKPSRWRRR
jgi:serine/threonine protein kinase